MSADGTVAPPPGPPHDPGMEGRVAALETEVQELKHTLRGRKAFSLRSVPKHRWLAAFAIAMSFVNGLLTAAVLR
jgi:hypothetical protein